MNENKNRNKWTNVWGWNEGMNDRLRIKHSNEGERMKWMNECIGVK